MLQLGTMPHVEIQVEACSKHRICKACSLKQRAKHELRTAWFDFLYSGYPTCSAAAAVLAAVSVLGCPRWDGRMGTDGRRTNWKLLPWPLSETLSQQKAEKRLPEAYEGLIPPAHLPQRHPVTFA